MKNKQTKISKPPACNKFLLCDIFIAHIKYAREEYDDKQFDEFGERIRKQIERLVRDGFQLLPEDLVSVFEDPNDEKEIECGDSIFYRIKHRQITYYKNKISVTYWVDDL